MADASLLYEVYFAAEGVDPSLARVLRLHAREGLSTSHAVDVTLKYPSAELEPRAWILRPAAVVVVRHRDGAVVRRFTGVVSRVGEHVTESSPQHIEVTIASPLEPLRLVVDYRIFQQKTTREIVAQILEEAGIPGDAIAWRLTGETPAREVATQLGETSFDFVNRLLEEDGITYFVEHGEDGAKLVFGDSSAAWATTAPSADIRFVADTGLTSDEAITWISEVARARPAKVTLRDHDFKRPPLDLQRSASDEAPLGRELYIYPGRYVDPDEGVRRARIRLEALAAEASGVRVLSSACSLTPGHTFTLSGALDPALDREYVVRDVVVTWGGSGGDSVLRADAVLLPTDVPYRPPQRTPRAVARGPHLAMVTGPSGEEIHTDEFGRVKVHFPWDRRSNKDDTSSAWVRVGQMHTSGSVAIPRVGWEVIVDFEDGDPDRPIVLGRLYNGLYRPPYPLPGNKTRSSLQSLSSPGGGGHNEVRMEDGAGGEHMHVHAEKDLNVRVANNKSERVANNATYGVGVDEKLDVGANQTLEVGAAYELTVGASQSWTVGASRTKTVSGAENVVVQGSRSLSIGGSHTTTSSRSVEVSTPASLTETVGGSCLEAAALGVTMAVAGAASVTVGGAKIEACVAGKSDFTIGAHATTVGGAFISAAGTDVGFNVTGAKATTVGGIWAANAGKDLEISSEASVNINVGGAVALNAAEIVLQVGGSSVTIAAGAVTVKSSSIKVIATGVHPELAPGVEDL
ncbi:type VI secretion system Vgr family protein [Sorangium sp. So ce118]